MRKHGDMEKDSFKCIMKSKHSLTRYEDVDDKTIEKPIEEKWLPLIFHSANKPLHVRIAVNSP